MQFLMSWFILLCDIFMVWLVINWLSLLWACTSVRMVIHSGNRQNSRIFCCLGGKGDTVCECFFQALLCGVKDGG